MTLSYVTWRLHMWIDSFDRSQCSRVCGRFVAYMYHDTCLVWRYLCVYDMPHSCVMQLVFMWYDAFDGGRCSCVCSRFCCIYVLWHAFMCDMTHSCVTWRIHMWHDSFDRGWCSFVCGRLAAYVWHDAFRSVMWFVCHALILCDMTRLYVT